jgi:hypothetical protein
MRAGLRVECDQQLLFKAQATCLNAAQHSTAGRGLYPFSTGLHRFSAQLTIQGVLTSTQYVQLDMLDSSNSQIGAQRTEFASTVIQGLTLRVDGHKYYNVVDGLGAGSSTQYVVLRVVMAGGASTVRAQSGDGVTWFAMTRL